MARRNKPLRFPFGALMATVLACSTLAVLATATPAAAVTASNTTALTATDATCGTLGPPEVDSVPGKANVYPSTITVSGQTGTISDLNVTLHGMTGFEGDFEVLLVGPAGGNQNLVLLSDAGSTNITNFTLTLDDAAASLLPKGGAWGTSPLTAKPTDYAEAVIPPNQLADSWPSPAPSTDFASAPTGSNTLGSKFDGISPNGTWSLYLVDDGCGDISSISGGWSLDFTLNAGAATTTTIAGSPNPSTTGQNVTFLATVTSGGSPVTTGTVTFTEGSTTLASNQPLNGSGQASFTKSDLPEGNHTITATYNGTASFNTSNGFVDQRVNNATQVTGNTFCNTGAITIPTSGASTPYPSNIFVSGLGTVTGKVTVTLKNVSHPFAEDIDALLVGPGAQNLLVVSDAGSGATTNVTATFDDAAASVLPATGPWGPPNGTVTAKPTDYDPLSAPDNFPAPAPAPSAATTLATFNGTNPNGTWSLYVVDDSAGDGGSIAGGWCITITARVPTVTTSATALAAAGQPISDTATVAATGGGPAPTGTVIFTAYGPADATCSGAAAFTSSAQTLAGGPPPTATGSFSPATAGTYRWRAAYSGDSAYGPVTTACNDANESSTVTLAPPSVTTQATPTATVGQSISDTATVTGGGAAPTGTVIFTAYGPADATCSGAAAFTSSAQTLAGGPPPTATGSFSAAAAGTYRWRAAYSGDANYGPLTTACNDANESSVVGQGTPTVGTSATVSAVLGGTILDSATVSGAGAAPTGTVIFTAFGPNNATCTGSPAFTSSAAALTGGPPPIATSNPFTPTAAGTYRWIASYSGDSNYAPLTTVCNDPGESSVVNQATPTVATQATATATLGQAISDVGTVTGAGGAAAPTGTVTFTAYGPGDTTCAAAPAFTSTPQSLAGGPPPTATGTFTPSAAGTYRWRASYSGDANYAAVSTACNDANESSVVSQATPTVATQATATASLGQPISDVATVTGVSGGAAPTGTMTFTSYGPNDATCSAAAAFTSSAQTLAGGPPPTATGTFTPTATGTYRWRASYSGDGNYPAVTTPCNDANESSAVTQAAPAVSTQATATASLGQPIADTATVTGVGGGPAPTGTVVFTAFGPNDATCAAAAVFTSSAQTVAGGPPPTAIGSFSPTVAGTYRWRAAYSGDTNYSSVTTACNDANETSTVNTATPTVTTQATASTTLGQPISDTATVAAIGGSPPPTGTVTFTAYGPNDATCAAAAVFMSSAQNLTGGPPPTATGSFSPTAAGTYRWRAAYSGDSNYSSVTTACNDANESSTVNKATPTVTTSAAPTAVLGQSISDTATVAGVTGAGTPTGTVTFTAYGAADATCSGAPVFTPSAQSLAGGPPPTTASGPFTPNAAGTYRWRASYSGDANYNNAATPCNAANESSAVAKGTPGVTTSASGSTNFGQPASDTATVTGVTGAQPPTGTVTFTAFGPNDATCSAAAAFTSAAQPLAGGPPPTAGSGPFTAPGAGTYRWVASYSGDANYLTATTACNDPNETTSVGFPGPHMTLTKTAAPAFAAAPANVTYTFKLTNDGSDTLFHTTVSDNHCSPVVLVSGDVNGDQLLNAGETWTFTCSQTISTPGSYTNAAQGSGFNTQTGLAVASNVAEATATVTSGVSGPHLTLGIGASAPTTGQAPLTVTYTYTVVNDGSDPVTGITLSDDLCLSPVYQTGDFNNDGNMGPGEVWTYTCTMVHSVIGTYTNHAHVTATDMVTNAPVTSNTATATVTATGPAPTTTTGPHMTLSKSANPTSGASPLAVTYTYTLVNDGTDTLFHVTVADNACSPVNLIGGDVNHDQLLQGGETWTFTCSQTLTGAGPHTNTATGSGTNTQTGLAVSSNTAQATVTVGSGGGGTPPPPSTSGPHLTLSKSANPTSGPGPLAVTYTYTLANDGTDTLFHVTVTDNACSPVALTAGDVNHDTLLQAGETWTFTCSTTLTGAGPHTNTATGGGTNTQTGLPVSSAAAQATVTVT